MLFRDNETIRTHDKWNMLPFVEPSKELQEVANEHNFHPAIVQLLAQRSIQDRRAVEEFLNPKLADLPDPFLMSGMLEAAQLACQSIINKKSILIWGDYDVDGITGTALLVQFFQELGANVSYVVPSRFKHGYGLNADLLREVVSSREGAGVNLLITVDCGISANKEIATALQMGLKVIVTDHHEPPEEPSLADVVVNPKQVNCGFPTEELAGVGIAFYLACGVRKFLREKGYFKDKKKEPDVRNLLDLVALGTIADMVPLSRVNRILVREGMKRIEQQQRYGMNAMLSVCGILNSENKVTGHISSEDIGFLLAPMVNAAGRLADPALAVQLLLCMDMNSAELLAKQLLELNANRKKICSDVFEACLEITRNEVQKDANSIVIKGNFHSGVIGIVASRLVETFRIPVLLFSEDVNPEGKIVCKGSGRSVPGIDLHSVLTRCAERILRFGGHEMAAGLTVSGEIYSAFKEKFIQEMDRESANRAIFDGLVIDIEAEMDEILSPRCIEQLRLFEPFGNGNKSPVFSMQKAKVHTVKQTGLNKGHLKLTFQTPGSQNKKKHQGIGFGFGNCMKHLAERENPFIAYCPMVNRFRDNAKWEARVIGIQISLKNDNL
jgi:single-stranded-DNA-specific exonuclease